MWHSNLGAPSCTALSWLGRLPSTIVDKAFVLSIAALQHDFAWKMVMVGPLQSHGMKMSRPEGRPTCILTLDST